MVKGLNIFRDCFRQFEGSFTLIGGAACDEWFTAQGLPFRATKDLDIVLIIEVLAPEAIRALRVFIADGNTRSASERKDHLCFIALPNRRGSNSRHVGVFQPEAGRDHLAEGQEIVPLPAIAGPHSLSAILLDDDYYSLIQNHKDVRDGLSFANATALIPLKANAWLNLSKRKAGGEKLDSKDIAKHRNDVFRLAGTLPGVPGPNCRRLLWTT